jgi:hypothetical protein
VALGAAFYGWLQVLGRRRLRHGGSTCFGRRYSGQEIQRALERHDGSIDYTDCSPPSMQGDVIDQAAELLAQGKVLGWFQEGSEFGPRALGNRSILALPTEATLKDFINSKIKFREDFRPFAPSVLAEDATQYFDLAADSPYMILVASAKAEWRDRIPAVVHVNGTARVQTVHKSITPRYHRLLEEVKRRTDLSVLLNTSLNRRGTPIVETPEEAITLFLETALDALILERWLVLKRPRKESPPSLPLEAFFGLMRFRLREATTAGIERGAGVLQFEITGVRERWAVDLRAAPRVEKESVPNPDYTIVVAHDDLLKLFENPGSLRGLFDAGKVKVPGLGRNQVEATSGLLRRLAALVSLAKS